MMKVVDESYCKKKCWTCSTERRIRPRQERKKVSLVHIETPPLDEGKKRKDERDRKKEQRCAIVTSREKASDIPETSYLRDEGPKPACAQNACPQLPEPPV